MLIEWQVVRSTNTDRQRPCCRGVVQQLIRCVQKMRTVSLQWKHNVGGTISAPGRRGRVAPGLVTRTRWRCPNNHPKSYLPRRLRATVLVNSERPCTRLSQLSQSRSSLPTAGAGLCRVTAEQKLPAAARVRSSLQSRAEDHSRHAAGLARSVSQFVQARQSRHRSCSRWRWGEFARSGGQIFIGLIIGFVVIMILTAIAQQFGR